MMWQGRTEPSPQAVGQGQGLPASRCLPVPDPPLAVISWMALCRDPHPPPPGSTSAPAVCPQAPMGRLRVGPGRAASPAAKVRSTISIRPLLLPSPAAGWGQGLPQSHVTWPGDHCVLFCLKVTEEAASGVCGLVRLYFVHLLLALHLPFKMVREEWGALL